jgi:hypothetical protein
MEQKLNREIKKRYSTSMERKRVLNQKYPCQPVTRILRKKILGTLRKSMQKTDLKTSTRKAQTHNFSKQVRRLRVFPRRLHGPEVPRFSPEVPRFSRRLRAVQKQQHEPRKNESKLNQNNSD